MSEETGAVVSVGEVAELRYAEALAQLEKILSEIEQDEVDLDELGERVERAAHLIQLCRDKIERAEMQVKRIVNTLEREDA